MAMVMVTERMRMAYGYIDDDRVVVTRPAAMREVLALKALRTKDGSSFLLLSDTTGNWKKEENHVAGGRQRSGKSAPILLGVIRPISLSSPNYPATVEAVENCATISLRR